MHLLNAGYGQFSGLLPTNAHLVIDSWIVGKPEVDHYLGTGAR